MLCCYSSLRLSKNDAVTLMYTTSDYIHRCIYWESLIVNITKNFQCLYSNTCNIMTLYKNISQQLCTKNSYCILYTVYTVQSKKYYIRYIYIETLEYLLSIQQQITGSPIKLRMHAGWTLICSQAVSKVISPTYSTIQ